MRFAARRLDLLSESEMKRIVDYAYRILDEVGMQIENRGMCEHLAAKGLAWDGRVGVKFPRKVMEAHVEADRGEPVSPDPKEFHYEGGISAYPMHWVDPADCRVKFHTSRSVVDVTRLADFLPNIHGIGSVGVPSDIPPLLRPFWMRFIDWRYAAQTLANSYVIWDTRLCPYILDFVKTFVEADPRKGGFGLYWRANNYMVTPLKYAKEEAAQFMWFHEHGVRCTIGNLPSIGGTTPVTIAGAVGMGIAESLALSFIMKAFYGDRGLYLHASMSPLDMRTGCMPYGRPEETLAHLAGTQIAQYLGSPGLGSAGHGTGSKLPDVECGLTRSMGAVLQVALLGKLDYGFGVYSTDEITDPRLVVIENEWVESLKRLARGFEVNDETLPIDVVKEVGPGGEFTSHPHTARHFREELWLPELFSGIYYEGWVAKGGKGILDLARTKVLDILDSYHPRGIRPETEERLLGLIDQYAAKLGVAGYQRPVLPE